MSGPDVVVVIGVGGMGTACARRLGSGRRLVLADVSAEVAEGAAESFRAGGFDAHAHAVDISSAGSVHDLVRVAAGLGRVASVVHTAGLSPTMAGVEEILAVDLVGTAHVIDAFETVLSPGMVAVVIASMSANLVPVSPEHEQVLASAPTGELLAAATAVGLDHPGLAYAFAKRGNQLRVRAAAGRWGRAGARIVSVSPGMISTGMGRQELDGESGAAMRWMLEQSPLPRLGTPEDIAAAVAWLVGPEASFVTGIDLLVDGGVVAAVTSGPG